MRAFTLIELMISIAILFILTGILVARYPDSSMQLNLVNVSHSVALSVREAQIRGSAIDSLNGQIAGYGLYFDLSTPSTSGKMTLFADRITAVVKNGIPKNGIPVGDNVYSSTPVDEASTVTNFPKGFIIKKACIGASFPYTCANVTSLTITFARPNPQPLIFSNITGATPQSGACLEIWSPKAPAQGQIRSVKILGTGLISTTTDVCE